MSFRDVFRRRVGKNVFIPDEKGVPRNRDGAIQGDWFWGEMNKLYDAEFGKKNHDTIKVKDNNSDNKKILCQ